MKQILLTTVLALVAATGWAQQQVKVNVRGTAPAEVKTVFIAAGFPQRQTLVDSVAVNGGKWKWEGMQPENTFLTASLGREAFATGLQLPTVAFFADGTDVVADMVTMAVTGSRQSVSTNGTMQALECIVNDVKAGRMPEGVKPDELVLGLIRDSVMANRQNMLPAVFLPMIAQGLSYGDLKTLFDTPDAPFMKNPNSQMIEVMEYYLQLGENMKKRPIGGIVADMTMADQDGRERKLSEWCGKGQWVLIDFWASWCGPCLQEMPNVIANYAKYHDKGFEIVGVSFDAKRDAWLGAVERLQMTWPQLSDLKGWQSLGSELFGIRSIPSNILVDPEGRITDVDLRGSALGKRLAEIYNDHELNELNELFYAERYDTNMNN